MALANNSEILKRRNPTIGADIYISELSKENYEFLNAISLRTYMPNEYSSAKISDLLKVLEAARKGQFINGTGKIEDFYFKQTRDKISILADNPEDNESINEAINEISDVLKFAKHGAHIRYDSLQSVKEALLAYHTVMKDPTIYSPEKKSA